MSKRRKALAAVAALAVAILAVVGLTWAWGGGLGSGSDAGEKDGAAPSFEELAEQHEHIGFDAATGTPYIDNEVLVTLAEDADATEAEELLSSLGASVDESMADLGIYRITYADALSYDELNAKVEELKANPLVEDAYLNLVVSQEPQDEPVTEQKPAVFPNDAWGGGDGATWDQAVPRGRNWGMEAIEAAGAWGYLDQLQTTRVGLIDAPPNPSHEDLGFSNATALVVDEDAGTVTQEEIPAEREDHGSHVAGTMAATWDNEKGVSGVMANKGELYYASTFLRSGSSTKWGIGSAYTYLLSIKTLVDQGVRSINVSLGFNDPICFAASHGNQNAINYIQELSDSLETGLSRLITRRASVGKPDFVICVAAGNENNTPYYEDSSATYGYITAGERSFWQWLPFVGAKEVKGGSLAQYSNALSFIDDDIVKDHIIVVGAVGIDEGASTSSYTRYACTSYSNVGARVDVMAPGGDADSQIYSCATNGYMEMSGTSMASPHVAGIAGLVFAANPSLTGPEVKKIVVDAAGQSIDLGGTQRRLANARVAVEKALGTPVTSTPGHVITLTSTVSLDLCFVVDTTASMGDDIDNAAQNMSQILIALAARTGDYRVALVDYRDFASRTNDSEDYPYRVQLDFTNSGEEISRAISNLELGYGGDEEETVYSALMAATKLNWREGAKRVIIVLGDAAPLDPEPTTGYTYDDVALALYKGGIAIDAARSDERVLGDPDKSLISVFSIGTDASDEASSFFDMLSTDTGGEHVDLDDASEVGDAIVESIDQIELARPVAATASFGAGMAGQHVSLYAAEEDEDGGDGAVDADGSAGGADAAAATGVPSEDRYLLSLTTDATGSVSLDSLPAGTYAWRSSGASAGGTLTIPEPAEDGQVAQASVQTTQTYWFTPLLLACRQNAAVVTAGLLGLLALCVAAPVVVAHARAGRGGRPGSGSQQAAPAPDATPAPAQGPAPTRFCPHCGASVPAGSRFCPRCGTPAR